MQIRTITTVIMVVNLFLLIIWDIVAVRLGGVEATISRILWETVKVYPGLAIAIGGLLGHLFFSQS